jgi:UDP-N-acetylmuramoylalanine--D-glutamate ligase
VLTALFPEHLTWHGSVERYYADKLNLVAHRPGTVVYNGRDPVLTEQLLRIVDPAHAMVAGAPDGFDVATDDAGAWQVMHAGTPLFGQDATRLRGLHNALNICLALTALAALGADPVGRRDEVAAALSRFEPLEHRLSVVPDASGLTFVDDSLSTAPQATVAALQAFPDGPIAVILGGEDRGVSYAGLRAHLAGTGRPVIAIGVPDSGPRIIAELDGLPAVTCHLAADIREAVALARRELPVPGTVLLSPGAPSYGRYADYAARGAAFAEAVRATA